MPPLVSSAQVSAMGGHVSDYWLKVVGVEDYTPRWSDFVDSRPSPESFRSRESVSIYLLDGRSCLSVAPEVYLEMDPV